jgi:hypothetical protein
MIVICKKELTGVSGRIINKKNHAYSEFFDAKLSAYRIETDAPEVNGVIVPKEIFDEYFRKFIP